MLLRIKNKRTGKQKMILAEALPANLCSYFFSSTLFVELCKAKENVLTAFNGICLFHIYL